MNRFLMLRALWWPVASLLLVANFMFLDGVGWLLLVLVLLALACYWSLYLLRAWLLLVVIAVKLTTIETVPNVISYGLVVLAMSGVLVLWYEYVHDYWQTQQERFSRQTELLAECQLQRSGVQTILILTASDGFGHLTAAKTWSIRMSEMNVLCIDVFTLLPPWLRRIWQSWEYLAVYMPEVHALFHYATLRSPSWLSRFVADYLAQRLPVTENVSQVITTHPLGAMAARSLLGRQHAHMRGTLVCTDFFVNPQALNFAFHEVKLPRDLTEGKSVATVAERDDLWRTLSLDTHQSATLILTGGSGLLPAEKIFKLLRWLESCKYDSDHQFVLTCGTNERLYNQAQKQLVFLPNVRVVRFIPGISRFFTHFDEVVCKAGGLTTAELLNAGNARIAIWYAFRGQERANLQFLKSWGAVYVPAFFTAKLGSWLHTAR